MRIISIVAVIAILFAPVAFAASVSVSPDKVKPGETLEIKVQVEPNEDFGWQIEDSAGVATASGTDTAEASGKVTMDLTLPPNVDPGAYSVVVTAGSGEVTTDFEVVDPAAARSVPSARRIPAARAPRLEVACSIDRINHQSMHRWGIFRFVEFNSNTHISGECTGDLDWGSSEPTAKLLACPVKHGDCVPMRTQKGAERFEVDEAGGFGLYFRIPSGRSQGMEYYLVVAYNDQLSTKGESPKSIKVYTDQR